MTLERTVSSIESSFLMEDLAFDVECRKRVRGILSNELSISDAINELNVKYKVASDYDERSRT
jgi:predicted RNase H-like nuclease (RuvC/YqgF family)